MENSSLKDPGADKDQPLAQLERQVERGSLFTHTIVSRNSAEIQETESVLYGVIDLLVKKGVITEGELLEGAHKVKQEMEDTGQTIGPGIVLQVNGAVGKEDFVPVNCNERLHICHAVCCKLHFALTAQEVESGKIKWDLGAPYYIRHETSGYCTHINNGNKHCGVYEDRPAICCRYTCAHDERIWKDFEKMVLNEEWINRHLGDTTPRLAAIQMLPQEIAFQNIETGTAVSDQKKSAGE